MSVVATGVGNQGLGNQVGNSPFLSTLCTDGIFYNVLKKKSGRKHNILDKHPRYLVIRSDKFRFQNRRYNMTPIFVEKNVHCISMYSKVLHCAILA